MRKKFIASSLIIILCIIVSYISTKTSPLVDLAMIIGYAMVCFGLSYWAVKDEICQQNNN